MGRTINDIRQDVIRQLRIATQKPSKAPVKSRQKAPISSRFRSRSPTRSGSGSLSGSVSKSPRSLSRSPRSRSKSPSRWLPPSRRLRSRSNSSSRSPSRYPEISLERSPERSPSRSPSRSLSRSPSRSPSRSLSRSSSRSLSSSPSRSSSRSPQRSTSRSLSRSLRPYSRSQSGSSISLTDSDDELKVEAPKLTKKVENGTNKEESRKNAQSRINARKSFDPTVVPAAKLKIKNLDLKVTVDDLIELFSEIGTVKGTYINKDRSGKSLLIKTFYLAVINKIFGSFR